MAGNREGRQALRLLGGSITAATGFALMLICRAHHRHSVEPDGPTLVFCIGAGVAMLGLLILVVPVVFPGRRR